MSRKSIVVMVVVILCTGLLVGCGGEGASSVAKIIKTEPEPYSKMIESINSNDLSLAGKYADLVIQDFPDSDYVYNAYLVKNMILSSKLALINYKLYFLCEGINQMGVLNTKSDLITVKKYLTDLQNALPSLQTEYDTTAEYLLSNYSKSDLIKIDFPKAPSDISEIADSDLQGLAWFAQIGTPIPTEAEMSGNDSINELKLFYGFCNGFSQEKSFSYVDYFYQTAGVNDNKDIIMKLLNKVIELTEDDQYNEYRIKAQDVLKLL